MSFFVSFDAEDEDIAPLTTELKAIYPNPFNPTVNISYSLKEQTSVTIEVFNIKGQKVKTIINEMQELGNHKVSWSGHDNNNHKTASGIYFVRIKADKLNDIRKVIMLK